MNRIFLAATTTVLFASAATASSITFSFPDLTFPPAPDTTVTQDCQSFSATAQTCTDQQ